MLATQPIVPPFSLESAVAKVRAAENAWNSRDPERVANAYSIDTEWRNRSEFISGREAVRAFLADKWSKELNYRLVKEMWAFSEIRIAVRFQYEYSNSASQWFRAYGNELWEFDDQGLMRRREASINDVPISEGERKFFWDAPGPRPDNAPGIVSIR